MGRPPELATMTSSSSVEPDASPDTHIASCNPFDALEACVGPAWSLHDTSSSARRSSVDDLPPNFRELLDELKSRCRWVSPVRAAGGRACSLGALCSFRRQRWSGRSPNDRLCIGGRPRRTFDVAGGCPDAKELGPRCARLQWDETHA